MTIDYKKALRKIIALTAAIIAYYIVHEGAHLVYALLTNTFEEIVFMFPGVQIKTSILLLSNLQIGIFNLLGAAATLTCAYSLCALRGKIAALKSNMIRAIFYYVTILFLLNDAIYLSALCDLFGGGDMNGIKLIIPEIIARISFGVMALVNLVIIFKLVVPSYRQAFYKFNKA